MKNTYTYTFLWGVVCLFALHLNACSPESDANKQSVHAVKEPLGIMLAAKDPLVGLEIAVICTPKAEEKKLAEAVSQAFHYARTQCNDILVGAASNIYSFGGISIFDGSFSVPTEPANDKVLDCMKKALNGRSAKSFKGKDHYLEVQFAIKKATP